MLLAQDEKGSNFLCSKWFSDTCVLDVKDRKQKKFDPP